jgi:hypothetical protein
LRIACPMPLRDETHPVASFVREEMVDGASRTLAACLSYMPPIVRLRLAAFMHLVADPTAMKAALEITPSGSMRLTLDTAVTPCPTHRHRALRPQGSKESPALPWSTGLSVSGGSVRRLWY